MRMMGWRCGAVIALCLALADVAPAQDVQLDRNDETYWVQGRDLAELRAALETTGPRDDDGQRHHGLAKTGLGWTYNFQSDGRLCRTINVRVVLQVAMVLPQWRDRLTASAALAADWDRYVQALRVHEQGHLDLARDAAQRLASTLEAVRDPECQALQDKANALGRDAQATLARAQSDYDRSTAHGRTQGAVL